MSGMGDQAAAIQNLIAQIEMAAPRAGSGSQPFLARTAFFFAEFEDFLH